MSVLHFLDTAIYRIQPALIAAAVSCWVIGVFGTFRAMRRTPPRRYSRTFIIAMICFAGIVGGEIGMASVLSGAALTEIGPILSGNIQSVTVNGHSADRADDLVNALRTMHSTMGHHSHPTDNFQVRLKTTSGQLELNLARDSTDPHEYWAFYPGFNSTTNNAVAHVFTDTLDKADRAPP